MLDRIYIFGEEILRKKLKPVSEITDCEKALFDEMLKVMYKANGLGLAANQVGIDKLMCVIDAGGKIFKLANPKIIKKSGKYVMEEGCLSLPDIVIKVERAKELTCRALNENNETIEFEATGLLCRAIQHEIDHLNGKLIIDYAPFWKKVALHKRLQGLRKKV